MQSQLSSLTKEFTSTAASAQRTLRGLFGGRKVVAGAPVPEGVPTAQLRPGYGASALEEPAAKKGSGREKARSSSRRSVSVKAATALPEATGEHSPHTR